MLMDVAGRPRRRLGPLPARPRWHRSGTQPHRRRSSSPASQPAATRPAASSSHTERRGTSAVANLRPRLPTPSKLSTWPNGSEHRGAFSSSAIWLRPSLLTGRRKAWLNCCTPSNNRAGKTHRCCRCQTFVRLLGVAARPVSRVGRPSRTAQAFG
ncbi:hypothetical protein QR77_39880 [Streptomyces sp. 150FB]|nr:hypothetical protein QR77_39880 [Streptomyces sp. 150FB]